MEDVLSMIKYVFRIVKMCLGLFLLFTCPSNGQYNNVWAFGQYAGIDFNYTPPQPITTKIVTTEGTAVICDDDGKLLFYTDGSYVWNKNHNLMPNGENLLNVPLGNTSSTSQAAVIIPFPGREGLYYLFSLGSFLTKDKGRLSYSIIDMTLDNGLGDVVTGKKGIVVDTIFTEHMTAVVGDNCNIWLVAVSGNDNSFYCYSIDFNGLDSNAVISQGWKTQKLQSVSDHIGNIDIAPNRKKLAITQDRVIIYDFDPANGTVNNPIILDMDSSIGNNIVWGSSFYGISFSPDNTKLYVSCPETYDTAKRGGVWQFDLSKGDSASIIKSKTVIYKGTDRVYAIKRAPDSTIYCTNYNKPLSIIKKPNEAGIACLYVHNAYPLPEGTKAEIGLPNVATMIKKTKISSSHYVNSSCPLVLTATDSTGINFLWNNNSSDNLSSYVEQSGIYWVSYQVLGSSCIHKVDTFYVTINPFPTSLYIVPACKDYANGFVSHRTDREDTNSYTYQWHSSSDRVLLSTDSFLSGIAAGDYTVYINNNNGCDTTLYFHVDELDVQVAFSVSDTLFCTEDEIEFYNKSNPHFDTLLWNFGDETYSTLVNPSHTYAKPGIYVVRLTGKGNSCVDTFRKTVVIDAPVEDLKFFTDKESICVGETIQFHTTIQDSTLTGLHWKFGNDNTSTTSDQVIAHAFDREGSLQVMLTAQFRVCPDLTFKDSITVYPFPLVNIGSDSVLCLKNNMITLRNKYPYQEGDRYLWNTGTNTPSLAITHEGDYSLTITNIHGCVSSESIKVRKDCYIDIPNTFSPNSDGVNDYFFPRQWLSNGIRSIRMQVLTRWGQKVFETTNINGRGWDGRFNGMEQPQGVYVYIIEVELQNGRLEKQEGHVTLIR